MRRLLSILLSVIMATALISPVYANVNEQEPYDFMDFIISHTKTDPVENICIGDTQIHFTYSGQLRTSLSCGDSTIFFEYSGNRILRQIGEDVIEFLYDGNDFSGFIFRGNRYRFVFDENGSVTGLLDCNDNLICVYYYEGAQVEVETLVQDANCVAAAHSNPIRYLGWYYDVLSALYYLGDGVYYDPNRSVFIHNPYYLDARGGEPSIVQEVSNAYLTLLSLPTYGAGAYSFPSQTNWNSGSRWYSGIQQVELLARCIYAENPGANRHADRKAIGLVIRNRVAQGFPHSGSLNAYNIVCYPSAFSTVNPSGSYSGAVNSTATARGVMNKTSSEFQQATFIACADYYATSFSDFSLVVGIPSYMTSSHTHFLAVNYVYDNMLFSIVTSGGNQQWMYGGNNIYGVCISGTALLSSINGSGGGCLQTYYMNGYNVFFKYSP